MLLEMHRHQMVHRRPDRGHGDDMSGSFFGGGGTSYRTTSGSTFPPSSAYQSCRPESSRFKRGEGAGNFTGRGPQEGGQLFHVKTFEQAEAKQLGGFFIMPVRLDAFFETAEGAVQFELADRPLFDGGRHQRRQARSDAGGDQHDGGMILLVGPTGNGRDLAGLDAQRPLAHGSHQQREQISVRWLRRGPIRRSPADRRPRRDRRRPEAARFRRGRRAAGVGQEDGRSLGITADQLDGRHGPRTVKEEAAEGGAVTALTPGPSPASGRGELPVALTPGPSPACGRGETRTSTAWSESIRPGPACEPRRGALCRHVLASAALEGIAASRGRSLANVRARVLKSSFFSSGTSSSFWLLTSVSLGISLGSNRSRPGKRNRPASDRTPGGCRARSCACRDRR